MVKVNLLPADLGRPRRVVAMPLSIRGLPMVLFGVGCLILAVSGYLWLRSFIQQSGLFSLNRQYREAETLARKMKVLRGDCDTLTKGAGVLEDYLQRPVIWSQKLTQLRHLIPAQIWLVQLSFDNQPVDSTGAKRLLLKGRLLPTQSTPAIAMVSDFVNKFKEEKDFFSNFDNIALTDLRSEKGEKNAEIMSFSIEMPLKEKAQE